MKKLAAIITVIAMLFTFAACNNNNEPDTPTEVVTDNNGETVTDKNGEVQTQVATEMNETTTAQNETTTQPTDNIDVIMPSTDPATWTDEEIVEFYKNAAIKSKTKVTSKQTMTLNEMVVNDGDGLLGKLVELATPFLVGALEDNSTEFEGITGGYENLVVSDTKSIKAYKSGEYTVVEMTLKEQTDGIHADRFSGTVGHGISVVGDISSVAEALPMFKIDFENADIKLHYANPKLKVKINKYGIIEKGTWTYTVEVTVANLNIAAVRLPIKAFVESAHGSVGYVIETGGGF